MAVELETLKKKADLIKSAEYREIRQYQIEKIIDLSTSDIDEKELKGMLKIIKYTDNWADEYESKIKKVK